MRVAVSVWMKLHVALVIALASLAPIDAHGQICGDADGSGSTTVSDGVQVLRSVAGLSSDCSGTVCDLDGDGTVTVTDGVATLQRAADLAGVASCGTGFGGLVKSVRADGSVGELRFGTPPSSSPGAPVEVLSITGITKIRSGETTILVVQLERPVDTLIVGLRENGAAIDGFVEVATGSATSVSLEVQAANVAADTTRELNIGSRRGDQIGGFRSTPLTVTPASTNGHLESNGDFSMGNTGFSSQYRFPCSGPGSYCIVSDAGAVSSVFAGGDHTTGSGLFQVVDGAQNAQLVVWSQSISVVANSTYTFEFWYRKVDIFNNDLARLELRINGVLLGGTVTVSSPSWTQFSQAWNSESAVTALIELRDVLTVSGGNGGDDFGVDDFSFVGPVP